VALLSLASTPAIALEDDYEFLPGYATGGIGSTGSPEATSRLVLGYPGQSATPGKNRWLESIDGTGPVEKVIRCRSGHFARALRCQNSTMHHIACTLAP